MRGILKFLWEYWNFGGGWWPIGKKFFQMSNENFVAAVSGGPPPHIPIESIWGILISKSARNDLKTQLKISNRKSK